MLKESTRVFDVLPHHQGTLSVQMTDGVHHVEEPVLIHHFVLIPLCSAAVNSTNTKTTPFASSLRGRSGHAMLVQVRWDVFEEQDRFTLQRVHSSRIHDDAALWTG